MTTTYYQTSCDLKVDILWRSGEPTDGTSEFDATSMVYLNRVYRSLCMGGSELNPDIQEDWWWLKKSTPGVLTLLPEYTTGTVNVHNNSQAVTFSSTVAADKTGWFLRITGSNGDTYRVSSHTAGSAFMTLDGVYTGTDNPAAAYKLFKLEYELASDVLRVISPMVTYRSDKTYEILGVDTTTLNRDWPIALTESGVPDRYAQADENTIRFNRSGGQSSTDLMRVEYEYLYMPTDLVAVDTSIPIVPIQWRHVLSDWASFWLLLDKNDDRADAVGLSAKNGLRAMCWENRHKQGSMGRGLIGSIQPRQDQIGRWKGPLRTESGMIIG